MKVSDMKVLKRENVESFEVEIGDMDLKIYQHEDVLMIEGIHGSDRLCVYPISCNEISIGLSV